MELQSCHVTYVRVFCITVVYSSGNLHLEILMSMSALKSLTGKPTGKIPLGRPRRRWEDNIRMDLEEIGINASNWVDSAQNRDYWRAIKYDKLLPFISDAVPYVINVD